MNDFNFGSQSSGSGENNKINNNRLEIEIEKKYVILLQQSRGFLWTFHTNNNDC